MSSSILTRNCELRALRRHRTGRVRRQSQRTSRAPHSFRWQWLGLWVLLVLASGCPDKSTPGSLNAPVPPGTSNPLETGDSKFVFEDVAHSAGVDFTYHNGEEADHNIIVESIGGGLGLFDFDRDGQLDVFCPGGGSIPAAGALKPLPCGLFRQREAWKFASVSDGAQLSLPSHFSHGCAIADFNNDGFPDVLLTGYGGASLYCNLGDGTFVEESASRGLAGTQFSTSAAWGDIDSDGDLDLYVAQYVNWSWDHNPACFGTDHVSDVCPPREFEGLDDRLYRNLGDGQFTDASAEFGLLPGGKGLGVVIGDIDLDGDSDIYVANDTTENRYYLNEEGTLQEQGLIQGVALDDRAIPNGSMGVDLADFDNDGLPDIWVANYEQELFALYHNEGELGFQYSSRQSGMSQLGDLFVGFGTAFGDLDLDGDEDIAVSNGHVIQTARLSPIRQLPLILRNDKGHFDRQKFPETSYLGQPHLGRGLTLGDIDHDGDIDLAISHNNEPHALLQNQSPRAGEPLNVRLIGTQSNRDAIGAICEWEAGGRLVRKIVKGGGSYLSARPYEVVFSRLPDIAGNPVPGKITIRWPNGQKSETAIPSELGVKTLTIVEPEPEAANTSVFEDMVPAPWDSH